MTTSVVVDASLAVHLILPGDERPRTQILFGRWAESGVRLFAPSLWAYEVTSAFSKAVSMGQIDADVGHEALKLAFQVGIELVGPDEDLAAKAFKWTIALKRFSAYDSFYLALAERLDAEFWTGDRRLANAVDEEWLKYAPGEESDE